MAIAAECPVCHSKQSVRNKICKCGVSLDKEKKSRRVKYHIIYRVNGKQKWESVGSFDDLDGYSVEDAKTAEAKRKVQKVENRLMDIKPEAKMTFKELAEWYLDLPKLKEKASYRQMIILLNKFNSEFGNTIISQLKPTDLENLQIKRKTEGYSDSYIDDEIGRARSMVKKAFENYKVGGDSLRPFMAVERLLKRSSNARDRVLAGNEYGALLNNSPKHLKDIINIGYWTGMRRGEILSLTWDKVDMKERMIRLKSDDTKEGKSKDVPIGEKAYKILSKIPQPIHGGHVFLYKGNPIREFNTSIKKPCEDAGILWGRDEKNGFIFHDLRHGFITDMRKAGVEKSARSSIARHSVKDMDDRYNRVDDEDKHEAIGKLEAFRKNVRQNVRQTVNEPPSSI